MCKHVECPYKGCIYHPEVSYEYDEPYWTPKTTKDMETCTAYLDI